MQADQQTAAALADTFTVAQLKDYRLNALRVKMEGGVISRSYEGSSMTINRENAEQIIADCNLALEMKAQKAAGETPGVTREAAGKGFDFQFRRTL